MSEDSKKTGKCTDCGSINLIRDYKTGEIVCENCGIILSSPLVNLGPEWRAFNPKQRETRTRVGSPSTWSIHDKGLSTNIDWRGRDASGRKLKPQQRAKVYRLRKWHRRSIVSGALERNLAYALSEISKLAYKLNLPRHVVETASVLYRKAIQQRFTRGRSILEVVAASLYMACRQCSVIRKIEEVAKVAKIPKKRASRTYRFLLKRISTDVPLYDPNDYISKLTNNLSLPGNVEGIALEIMDNAKDLRLTSGRSASGIAAACTYIACKLTNELRTQHEVAHEAQVTEVTIRNRYKELMKELEIEVEL